VRQVLLSELYWHSLDLSWSSQVSVLPDSYLVPCFHF
jgi:hypothetical protein